MKTMTIGEIVDFGKNVAIREIPIEGMLWRAGGSITKSRVAHNFKVTNSKYDYCNI